MPEKKGFIWDSANGVVPKEVPEYNLGMLDPAVVSVPLPEKFNGSQEAAKRYAEGYRWGQENVVEPRERTAPYVAAGLGATMAAPLLIDAAATGLASAAIDPLWAAASKKMAMGLSGYEAVDRLPYLWNGDRFSVQGGDVAESGFRRLSPDGSFEDAVAPYINQAGQLLTAIPVGGVSGALGEGLAGKLASGIKFPRGLNKRISRFKELYNRGRYNAPNDPEYSSNLDELRRNAISKNTTYMPTIPDEGLIEEAAERAIQSGSRAGSAAASDLYRNANDMNLMRLMNDFPEFGEFVAENRHLNPVSQEAVDAFARRQASAMRGVAVDAGDESMVSRYLSEPGRIRTGGDRLGSSGGVYTSNSRSIGERFMHPQNGKSDGVLGTLAYPIKYDKTLPLDEQLSQIREGFFNYDDVLRGVGRYGVSHNMISDAAKRAGFMAGESMYTNRNGARLPAFERVSLLDTPLEIQQKEVFPGLENAHGRWATTGVQAHPDDSKLFIPHETSRVDKARLIELMKELKTPKTNFDAVNAIESDYVGKALRAAGLVENSVPYWIGEHSTDISNAAIPIGALSLVGTGAGLGFHDFKLREKYDYNGEKQFQAFKDYYGEAYPPRDELGDIDVKKAIEMERNSGFRDYYNSLFREWKKSRKKNVGKSSVAQSFDNGGLISRLQKHYGSNEKALEAVRKLAGGGPIGEGEELVGPPVPYSLVTAGDIPLPDYNIFEDENSFKKRDAHLKSLDSFIAANPTVAGLNTADFRDVLSQFAGLESSYNPKASNKSGYSGYYGLEGGSSLNDNAQHRKAYEHLASLFKHNITRDDVQKGIDMGYTPAQILYKYWNQQNNATEFLQNGSAETIGNNPELELMGNNINAIADYYKYIPEAIMDDFHVVKSGDNFSTIQERVRKPGRHYNQAGKDLKQWNTDDIVNGKLRIGDKVWFTEPYADGGHLFEPGGTVERRNYNGVPTTLESYKQQQRNAIIDSAVQKALERDEGVAPVINGKLDESCLYTVTDNFGKKYRVAGNQAFMANPGKYGFEVNGPIENAGIGTLYQFIDPQEGLGKVVPHHMVLITGYDDSGNPLVSYSHGNAGLSPKEKDYKRNTPLWDSYGYETYRFVGTPDDNVRWEQEYAALPAYDLIPPVHNNLENLRDDYRLLHAEGGLLKDYRSGGKIHIKPENRGKFTALKKRTGHSASWFKAHGTPAQKKMATFALNARKWKHGDGGVIDRLYNHSGGDVNKMLELIQKARSA